MKTLPPESGFNSEFGQQDLEDQIRQLNKKMKKLKKKNKDSGKKGQKKINRKIKKLKLQQEQLLRIADSWTSQNVQQRTWWQDAVTQSLPKILDLAVTSMHRRLS